MAKKPKVAPIPQEILDLKDNSPEQDAAIGKWLARQDEATQDWYLWENPEFEDEALVGMKANMEKALYAERNDAFLKGEYLPGVNSEGQGTTLDAQDRARAVQARAQDRVVGAADRLPQSVDDYTMKPTLDQGAGYDLVDRMRMLGDAQGMNLDLGTRDQGRSDATGYDAQVRALKGVEGALGEGGLSAIDRARIAQSSQIRSSQARGAQEAIRANAEEQGRAGGRQQFMLEQQAQQSATGQRAMDDLQTQALALGRMDTLRDQQARYGQEIQSAQDVIDQFNTEDARAQRDVGNRAEEARWGEQNRRDSANVGTTNQAEGVDFATKTARSSANTDRANAAEAFNKSPSGGARGLFRERLAAQNTAAGHEEVGASLLNGQYQASQDRDAAQEAAIIGGVTGLASGIGDIATAGLTAPEGSVINPKKQVTQ